MYFKYLVLFLCLIMPMAHALAQESTMPDTAHQMPFITDSSIINIFISDTLSSDTSGTERFIDNLKEFARRDNIWAKLLRSVLVVPPKASPPEDIPQDGPVAEEDTVNPVEVVNRPVSEYYIRHIHVEVLDVFGPSIQNPDQKARSWFHQTANKFHYNTRPSRIKNILLFSKGEKIDPMKLSESERLIRENQYIYDARVIVIPIEGTDSADILVKAQDVWSISAFGKVNPKDMNGQAVIRENNLFGLGHRLENRITISDSYRRGWNYGGSYFVPNIWKTHFAGHAHYFSDSTSSHMGTGINRWFLSPGIKWTGGVNYNYSNYSAWLWNSDTAVSYYRLSRFTHDYWAGYSVNLRDKDKERQKRSQVFAAGRWIRNIYHERPPNEVFQRNYLYNHNLFLFSTGIMYRNYYHDSHIFGFGRREDVPEGFLLALTGGYEPGEIYRRPYAAFKFATGSYYEKLGYLRGGLAAGGFLNNKKVEQGVISAELFYFTNILPAGNWKIRQYIWNRYVKGINRRPGEVIVLHQGQGIRGFEDGIHIHGDEKFTLNYEINFFSPWDWAGFKSAFVVFADLGLLGTPKQSLLKGRVYQGYGIGLRVKNEHLVFQTVQLMLGFYPVRPFNDPGFNFINTNRAYYHFHDFNFVQPHVIPF